MLWVVVLECLTFVGIMLFGSFVAIYLVLGLNEFVYANSELYHFFTKETSQLFFPF